jgi:acetyltransferase-like isoleucine patch superfamily enzyme
MNEKEKMLKGMLYFPSDKELENERIRCKLACQTYNNIIYNEFTLRESALKRILIKTKGKFLIEPPFWCDYGYNIEIGQNFYANHGLTILDPAPVIFGDNVFIGPDCGFYTAAHPLDVIQRREGFEFAKPIVVGNDVWFGGGVKVMPGVTIGSNVVVAAGAIVTKDIPDNSLVAGIPAKVAKNLS